MNNEEQTPAVQHSRAHPLVPWTAKTALFGLVLVMSASLVTFALLTWVPVGSRPDGGTPLIALGLGLLQAIIFVIVWTLGVRRHRVRWRVVGFRRPQVPRSLLLAALALFLSLAFAVLYAAVATAIGVESLEPQPIPDKALGEGVFRLANIAVIGIMGPLAEEVFFRGFLLAALVQPLGPIRAMAVGAAIFSASHLNLGVLIPFFVTGCLLSWLYLKTRSVWPPFAAHSAQNFIAMMAISAAA